MTEEANFIRLETENPLLAHLAGHLADDLREDGYEVEVRGPRVEVRGLDLPTLDDVLRFVVDNLLWEATGGLLLARLQLWWGRRKTKNLTTLTVERFDPDGTLRERLTIEARE